jgi:proteasome lid subunit RPN8/RPN11
MRWQDQSESTALPALSSFLATLTAAQTAHLAPLGNASPRIAISADCFKAMLQHLRPARVERGGLLVGQAFRGCGSMDEPELVAVDRSVESTAFDATGVSLRMEAAVWEAARPLLRDEARIVGWYHSHPDLGAFFSDTDRTTQRAFFRQRYSVGIVIDPVRAQLRAYLGPECREIPAENIIVHDARGASSPWDP